MNRIWKKGGPLKRFAQLLIFIFGTSGCLGGTKPSVSNEPPPENTSNSGIQIVRDSTTTIIKKLVPLSPKVAVQMDQLARGFNDDNPGECLFLSIEDLEIQEVDKYVIFAVYIDQPDANGDTGVKTPNFLTSFSQGHTGPDASPSNFSFGLDRIIERLGENVYQSIERRALNVCLVAVPASANNKDDLSSLKVSISDINISTKCD